MLLMINRGETGSYLHTDKSSFWPFDGGTFTFLCDISCPWLHVEMLLGQVVSMDEGKARFVINLSLNRTVL